MKPARKRDLKDSLRRELHRQSAVHCLSPIARVRWLVEQLENYVERWRGLCKVDSQAKRLFDDDLFFMVEIGAEVVSEELRSVEAPAIANRWHCFVEALAAIRIANPPATSQLTDALAALRSKLALDNN